MQQLPDIHHYDPIPQPVFMLTVGLDNVPRYTGYNKNALAQVDFTNSEIAGKTVVEIFGEKLGAEIFKHHCEVARNGRSRAYEARIQTKGKIRTFRTQLEPVLGENGQISLIIGTSIDITQDGNLPEAKITGQNLVQEIEHFINMAAHDLRKIGRAHV